MSEHTALPGDETDNTTVEATVQITTHTDGEETERQADNSKLTATCGLTRQSFTYRVCAAIIAVLVLILLEVLKPNESAVVSDLRDLVFQYALNLTQHGEDG